MTTCTVTYRLVDGFSREGEKTFVTQNLADYPAVVAAAAAFLADLQAITGMGVLRYTITQEFSVLSGATLGANKDAGITLSVRKADSRRDNLKIPGPELSIILPDGTVDIADAIVTGYFANFTTSGDWTLSDGEIATEILSGRLDV